MLNLTDREWGAFPLGSLFSLETGKGKGLNHLKQTEDNNGISYLGATNRNNGVLCFVEQVSGMIQRGNCIAFIRNGEGSIGYSVYKAESFIASSDLTIGYSDRLNRCNGVFITTVADTVRGKYNFNYKRSDTRLAKEMLQLPVDEWSNPDWAFMENYIREREEILVKEYKQCMLNRCVIYDEGQLLLLNQADWREFELCEIFPIIRRGKRLKTADHISGNKPYVSSSAMNNGVDNFVANKTGVREFGNCITIANSGSVGQAFYYPYNFVAGDRVTQLKNDSLSRRMYTFLLPLVSRLNEKYNFNHEINDVRIRREKILLPVTDDGEPDWGYMEEYIREREDRLIAEYKEHIGKYFHESCKNRKIFELDKIFVIRATSGSIDKINLTGKGGVYPYVTRSDANNGINGWIAAQPAYAMNSGNCITVGLDTQTVFYQSAPFYTGQNIQVFTSEHMNADNAQFIVPLLRNAMTVFNWGGNGATLTRLRRSKIMLPADERGEPDWAFMKEYGQMARERKICAYLDYLENKV